jgi:hypothetical protein
MRAASYGATINMQIERQKIAAGRVGVGTTVFGERYVDKGGDPFVPDTDGTVLRVRPVSLGERAVGFSPTRLIG